MVHSLRLAPNQDHDSSAPPSQVGTDDTLLARHTLPRFAGLSLPVGAVPAGWRTVVDRWARASGRGCDAASLVQDLDRGFGDTRLDGVADQPRGHGLEVLVDLNVIVGRDVALPPLGIAVRLLWAWNGTGTRPASRIVWEAAAGLGEKSRNAAKL
jgi:hypothetical protein